MSIENGNRIEGSRLPRILIVVMPKVRADDSGNLLIRMQFGGWPKEQLAQIYSNETQGQGGYCGHYYALEARDRVFGKLFMRTRNWVSKKVAMEKLDVLSCTRHTRLVPRWVGAVQKGFGDILIHSGVWEVLFRVRVSHEMEEFVRGFRPDLIYCSGYSLAFATLPLLIADKFNVPICFQTLEDWPSYSYVWSPIGALVRRQARRLICRAVVRLAFGEKMKCEYEKRYGVPFHVTYHLDDPCRFQRVQGAREGKPKLIVFTGSLVLNRHESVEDLLEAMRLLEKEGLQVELEVYCTGVPKEMSKSVRSASIVKFLPLPTHDLLPQVLRNADILFLPEAFSMDARRLGLAISTKCHLYMMAERPILAYGPGYGGTIEYAHQEGWAKVVQQRSITMLTASLRELLSDRTLGERLICRASECFFRNHDLGKARERFQQLVTPGATSSLDC